MPNLEPDIEKGYRKSALKLTFSMISLRVSRDFPCPGNDSIRKKLMDARVAWLFDLV